MRTLIRPSRLLASATVPLLVLALVRPAHAGSPAPASGSLAAALHAYRTSVGLGSLSRPASGHSPAFVRPIITPVPIGGIRLPSVDAPGTYPLQASASAVTVKWYDRSNDEQGFKVFKRDLSGNWQMVYQVATRDMAGSGYGNGLDDYSWVDTSTDMSGQCYMIAAYNDAAAGYTSEECTVRPDPNRFPQAVGSYAPQWSGLSSTNDGTGDLVNTNIEQNLLYGNQTWGVNLTWGNNSLWRVEAQGGPHLMKGQAVALRVWGGGWLKYGSQTFGVDLQLSSTPVYEWYPIGLQGDSSESTWAGSDLEDGGTFALWNSSAQAYLVHGHETWGVDLEWYRVGGGSTPSPTPTPTQHGVKTEHVLNCSDDQQAVEVWIADLTIGGGFVDEGTVGEQYGPDGCPADGSVPLTFSPQSGHSYELVATDSALSGCDGSNDPQDGACQKMIVSFVGDANGFTRTDTVGIGTQITS
ncbi:MAG TPA: hypothetical protein VN837_00640 [Chloroflexota bacterium]|nr:hypothetical protein [Chloroflexota bacterium]